jgi:hypothetical protein
MIGLPRSTYYQRSVVSQVPRENDIVVDRDDALREAIVAVRQAHPAYGIVGSPMPCGAPGSW